MKKYKDSFFADRDAQTRYAAHTVLGLVLELLPGIRSAIDVGCGVGTWLAVLQEKGVEEIQGVDGNWVNQELLAIPRKRFLAADFNQCFTMPHRYDLAISLEVAEHLRARNAALFVETLAGLSDVILFSAAIPHQGGRNHLNEQWPDYWARLFAARNYAVLDVIRGRIWNDAKISYWYRQNSLIFVRRDRLADLRAVPGILGSSGTMPLAVVHPELYLSKNPASMAEGWKMFRRGVRASFRRWTGHSSRKASDSGFSGSASP